MLKSIQHIAALSVGLCALSAPLRASEARPGQADEAQTAVKEATAQKNNAPTATGEQPLRIDSGIKGIELVIPVKEQLGFVVELNMAVIGRLQVGTLVLTSKVDVHRTGLPVKGSSVVEANQKRKGYIRARARGGYMGYTLDHSIDARILPQKWPRVIVHDYQAGTENRRREVMYGTRNDKPMSWYRRDRHCNGCDRLEHFNKGRFGADDYHCRGCKRGEHRDWDSPKMQPIPTGALDMISSIFLARELVRTQGPAIDFPLLDKDGWWDLTMVLGDRAEITVPAGTFACQAVKLDPKPPANAENRKEFKGLFGIHGTLSIWLHEGTGVPVKIEGIVPLGPLNLDVAIVLANFTDTEKAFAPLGQENQ